MCVVSSSPLIHAYTHVHFSLSLIQGIMFPDEGVLSGALTTSSRSLSSLHLDSCGLLTDEFIRSLVENNPGQQHSLESLAVRKAGVTDEGVNLICASCPKLRCVRMLFVCAYVCLCMRGLGVYTCVCSNVIA